MKTPFSVEQFFEIFRKYNEAVFPIQVFFYLIGAVTIFLIIKPTNKTDKIISGVLAFFWLWMGIVYHLIFFTAINKAAYFFGAVFIFQGILFLYPGVIQNKLSFKFHTDFFEITGVALILFALIVYPVWGGLLGHNYPSSPTFGLPCPTTIFTFGLLLLSDKKIPIWILLIPLIWSVIGFTAAFNFGIVEDSALLVSGFITFSMLVFKNKKSKLKQIN